MGKPDTAPNTGAFVSPYLRRPLRTFDEFMREQAERTAAVAHAAIKINGMDDARDRRGTDDDKPRL